MAFEIGFRIMTEKELLDEQLIHEDGKLKFRYLNNKDVLRLLERAFVRMKSNGWELRAIQTAGIIFAHSRYVFERTDHHIQPVSA